MAAVDRHTIILGDIEERKIPKNVYYDPTSKKIEVKAELLRHGSRYESSEFNEYDEFDNTVFVGDIAKGWLSTTHVRMICQLIADGKLAPEQMVLGNRDFNMIYTGILMRRRETRRFVEQIRGVIFGLFDKADASLTYAQLKQRYCVKGNEPWIDKRSNEEVKVLFIAYIAEVRDGAKPTDEHRFTREDIASLFAFYDELEPLAREQLLLRFLHNECFGCPDGYEKFMLNEAVEWIREILSTWLADLDENELEGKSKEAVALLRELYFYLQYKDSTHQQFNSADYKWNKIKTKFQRFVEANPSLATALPEEWGNLTADARFTDLNHSLGKNLHHRVKDLLSGLSDPEHALGKHLQKTVVSTRTSPLNEDGKLNICLHHTPLVDGKQSILADDLRLADVLDFSNGFDLFKKVLHYNQPREEGVSVAQNSYQLGFAAGAKNQVIHFQGHKPVPAVLMTADGHIFVDLSLPSNPNDPINQAVRIDEWDVEGEWHAIITIPEQKIAVSKAYYDLDGQLITQQGQQPIETMKTVYDASEHRFRKGLPHFSVPFEYLIMPNGGVNSFPNIVDILDMREKMKHEQAVIAGWRKDSEGGYIATIHALGEVQGSPYKNVLIDIRLVDLLKQINHLEMVPALRDSLVSQAAELTLDELKALFTATAQEHQPSLLADILPEIHDGKDKELKLEFLFSQLTDKISPKIIEANFSEASLEDFEQFSSWLGEVERNGLLEKPFTCGESETSICAVTIKLKAYLIENLNHISAMIALYQSSRLRTAINAVGYIGGFSGKKSQEIASLQREFSHLEQKSCKQLVNLYRRTLAAVTMHRTAKNGELNRGTDTRLASLVAKSMSTVFRGSSDSSDQDSAHAIVPVSHMKSCC